MKNNFKVIFVIIGAFIGAGFASGKEIYTFFCVYGKKGIIGLFISAILLSVVVYRTFNIVKENRINNYKEFIDYIMKSKNRFLNDVINFVINSLMLISFFIMIAGFGAYFNQEFGINSLIGSGILAVFSYFILKKDIRGLIKINEIIVPTIIFSIIIIGILYIGKEETEIYINQVKVNSNFFINSILYCSYNCIMLIPILISIKRYVKNKKSILLISFLSGIIILLLSIIMFFILNTNSQELQNIEIPITYILNNNIYLKNIYGIIILSAISTTAISIGSGFLKNVVKNTNKYPHIIKIMCISAVAVSQLGFSNLINLLYPIFRIYWNYTNNKIIYIILEKIEKNWYI